MLTLAGDEEVEALAVAGGRIAYVGADAGARAHAGPGTEVIDLGGRTVLPGIHDAHLHPLSGGQLLASPTLDYRRLGKAAFLEAMAGLLARAPGPTAGSSSTCGTPPRWTRSRAKEDLDALGGGAPDPRRLARRPHRAGELARARARRRDAATPDPPGGVIVRDAAGEPTGILLDHALDLVARHVPAPTAAEDAAALRAAHEALAAQGVTSYLDASAGRTELAAVAALSDAGGLLVRPSAAILVSPELAEDPAAMLAQLEALRAEFARPGRHAAHRQAVPRRRDRAPDPDRGAARALPRRRRRRLPGPSRGPTYFAQHVADRAVAALDAAGLAGPRPRHRRPRDPLGARRLRARARLATADRQPAHDRPPRARAPRRPPALRRARRARRPAAPVGAARPLHRRAPRAVPRPGPLARPLPRRPRSRRPARRCAAAATGPSTRSRRSRRSPRR